MDILNMIFQAVVQGLTEFLPVSSSGHLSLAQHFTGMSGDEAVLTTIVLHLGTLVAVCVAFYDLIWALLKEFVSTVKDIFTGKFSFKNMSPNRRMLVMLVIATAPLLLFYFVQDFPTSVASDDDIVIEGLCFLYTGTILFLSDRFSRGKKRAKDIRVRDALTVGIFQGIALMPGISRSGSTIAGGLFCGFTRETAVRFSFLMSIPPILAGALMEFKDIGSATTDVNVFALILGFIVAAVVGFAAIILVKWLIKTDKFRIFAYYTFALGILVLVIGIIEHAIGCNLVDLFVK